MGFAWRGESWKTSGAAFYDAAPDPVPPDCSQYVQLSTCNRREVFYFDARERGGDREAIAYFFRIAAGLESMVLGEYQILGQVREACAKARLEGHVGKELDRIMRDAVTCAKKVKSELDLGAVPPSVCRAGMDEIERHGGCRGRRVFVIGSGRTGTLAAQIAAARGAKAIAVCNRSAERAARLARELGAEIVPYERRYAAIADSEVVVSATASPHVVVECARVALDHPTVFLDLALPRDIEPAVGRLPMATLVGIDTIGELALGERAERAELTARGLAIVAAAVDKTEAWLNAL